MLVSPMRQSLSPQTRIRPQSIYYSSLALIALLFLASGFTISSMVRSQREHARIVNIAGAQRMLFVRTQALANQIERSRPENGSALNDQFSEAVERIKQGHLFLVVGPEGLAPPARSSARLEEMYFHPTDGLSKRVATYIFHAEAIVNAPRNSVQHQESLKYIRDEHLLPSLDTAVKRYEEHGRAEISKIERWHWILTCLGLVLVLGEALFIFRPLGDAIEQQTQRLEQRADRDGLTGLLNRRAFEERARERLEVYKATGAVLLTFDLDWFKAINDNEGHDAGDAVLAAVGERIRNCLGRDVVAGRLGGDEFAVLLTHQVSPEQRTDPAFLQSFGETLRDSVKESVSFDGKNLQFGTTLGLALFPEHGDSLEAIFAKADAALLSSKAVAKGSVTIFHDGLLESREGDIAFAEELESARNGFGLGCDILWETRASLRTDDPLILSAEISWTSPVGRTVSWSDLTSVAAANQQLDFLLALVLPEVLCQYHALKNMGNNLERLSLPVTSQIVNNFQRSNELRNFIASIEYCIGEIEFRIDESLLLDRVSPEILATLRELQNLGATVCLDNFGKGTAHLSNYQKIAFDKVILRELSEESVPYQRGIIAFAKGMGARVVLKVTDEPIDREFLLSLGIDRIQGPNVAHLKTYIANQDGPSEEIA